MVVLLAAANRGERRFPDGDLFDIHRSIEKLRVRALSARVDILWRGLLLDPYAQVFTDRNGAARMSRPLVQNGEKAQGAMIAMPIGAVSFAAAGVVALVYLVVAVRVRQRRPQDTIVRYSRAVSALRALAEHPRPACRSVARNEPGPDANIRIAVPPVPRQRSVRKAATGRRTVRPNLAFVAQRPTVANLPSISSPATRAPDPDLRAHQEPLRDRDELEGPIGA
jgi:hypothetical protein